MWPGRKLHIIRCFAEVNLIDCLSNVNRFNHPLLCSFTWIVCLFTCLLVCLFAPLFLADKDLFSALYKLEVRCSDSKEV